MILSDRSYYLQYYKENDLMVKICLPFIPCSGIVMSRNWITYMSRIFSVSPFERFMYSSHTKHVVQLGMNSLLKVGQGHDISQAFITHMRYLHESNFTGMYLSIQNMIHLNNILIRKSI